MRVLITGANGFIGKNLKLHLLERKDIQIICFTRSDDLSLLPGMLQEVDFVFHLAGVNRPQNPEEFTTDNVKLTQALCQFACTLATTTGKKIPIVYASSIQVESDNLYGQSKRVAENELLVARQSHHLPVHIFRLPNVFGKWSKPNYNSAVATFCYNIARGLPIQVHDPATPLTLVYIDDVIGRFIQLMDGHEADVDGFASILPQYKTTVGKLAGQIQAFKESRSTLKTERVGTGLVRALYATYVSYLPVEKFAYTLPAYIDPRGTFVEMLKTPDAGQFSYFTAHPGATRGGHYHHSKTEKFLVIRGRARFKFRHMQSGEAYELITTGDKPEIVETVPGWTHDITNIGSDEMIVMLWANEIFNIEKPDTFSCPL